MTSIPHSGLYYNNNVGIVLGELNDTNGIPHSGLYYNNNIAIVLG